MFQGGDKFHDVFDLQGFHEEGVGAELVACVKHFDVGKAGEHHYYGTFGQFFLLHFLEDSNAIIRLHDEIEEDNEMGGGRFGTSGFEVGKEIGTAFEQVDGIQQFAIYQGAMLGLKVGLGVVH